MKKNLRIVSVAAETARRQDTREPSGAGVEDRLLVGDIVTQCSGIS